MSEWLTGRKGANRNRDPLEMHQKHKHLKVLRGVCGPYSWGLGKGSAIGDVAWKVKVSVVR